MERKDLLITLCSFFFLAWLKRTLCVKFCGVPAFWYGFVLVLRWVIVIFYARVRVKLSVSLSHFSFR